jgi:PTS system mannose-specific IIB component/fructoselysine and glucoselysine-specific PTS system IIB component
MGIVLYRVDERLIHGQVVLGWGRRLHPERYVVVDEELAEAEWEQELYRLSVDGEAEILFLTVEGARAALPGLREDPVATVLLTRDVFHMQRLALDGGLAGEEVNLGGIHHRPGRVAVQPYLHLDEAERDALRAIAAEGVRVTARDLPETARVSLENLIG